MAVPPAPALRPALYRLRLRHGVDFARRPQARGAAEYLPPEQRHSGLVTVEYELHAQPPARWRLRRVLDVGGEPPGRDERLVLEDRWYWFHPNDDVEYNAYRREDAVPYDAYRQTVPDHFRHLFEPDSLLALCQVEQAPPAVLLGRSVRVVVARPLPGQPARAFAAWGPGADAYRLHIDESTGLVLRAEALGGGRPLQVDEVVGLELDPDVPPALFEARLDPGEVLYRRGDIGPGRRVPPARAARYAAAAGFDLLLPQPLPPGASLRVWDRPLGRREIRVQVDLASGRHVVLLQYAADYASGPPAFRGRTCLDVSGTAEPEERGSLLALLAPVRCRA
ncbi:hypothetical protein H1V43_37785 [Streptomyces sp. PSKA54]|uniref:Uncharacterized protein n=1 Tax=Streptomyces himalayensis subsp. aureolus TaxID=2758039 RepID=A0A7W2D9F9_9ACTN|nr:hypothetical protein [Streptomyces himalayensis]MBA4866950.1 hypothetical protein [Streptomyces himalayensis subsp. aureolus]